MSSGKSSCHWPIYTHTVLLDRSVLNSNIHAQFESCLDCPGTVAIVLINPSSIRRRKIQVENSARRALRPGPTERRDSTQPNCFVEMSRVVAVVTPKDATQPNCLVESGLSVWPRSRSDSTSHDQSWPVLQILNIFSFWPVELSRIVSTVTPKDATR